MLTIATIYSQKAMGEIYFDMDDSGDYYLKQGDDWIILDEAMLSKLAQEIEKQLARR